MVANDRVQIEICVKRDRYICGQADRLIDALGIKKLVAPGMRWNINAIPPR
jgi:hypothetical protein